MPLHCHTIYTPVAVKSPVGTVWEDVAKNHADRGIGMPKRCPQKVRTLQNRVAGNEIRQEKGRLFDGLRKQDGKEGSAKRKKNGYKAF